ncbi:PREDICTED: uncharacterized protein LOC105973864 [Erythranthe guttata]|uniref:uncharacterized protein LOC105973864 n=1 Tax=Erythranthe guttata TaxID=4155 RepID=UPI00064DC367|nr:PREDICTED: uncharacterized protein LOC105973864 [Erythranthe guttata]|eukprot:XP_012854364.1 PREDICTED: uncharacterized protein LOC105973864 [Erythranthe guttata]
MALVQRYGKPDIFLTMTCNPSWKEIKDKLLPNEKLHDRPVVIARVFKAKLAELKDEIVRKKTFCFYPCYKRRDDGKTVVVRKVHLDNRHIVPYCPYLLAKYDCHINVEKCSNIKLVKYLYKYIYKGHDKMAYHVVGNESHGSYDEIHAFQDGRAFAKSPTFALRPPSVLGATSAKSFIVKDYVNRILLDEFQ